jgi:hypothetical protein
VYRTSACTAHAFAGAATNGGFDVWWLFLPNPTLPRKRLTLGGYPSVYNKRRIKAMEYKDCFFGNIRKQAFLLWEQETHRNCHLVNDDITGSFECKWQDRATEDFDYEHISIFCSLGEWANNISDSLKDVSCDYYSFSENDHRQALFRYYTRILLIVSEMLCDFEDIVKKIESLESKKAREFLSSKKGEVNSLHAFINTVCKHKVVKLHLCNHHLPIGFNDCSESCTFIKPISIENLDFNQPDGILLPRLSYFVHVILECYSCLDKLFEQETDKFKMICDEYNGTSYEV